MNWLQRKRIVQAIKYGWADAKKISAETGTSRWHEYITYLSFFRKHFVFSNQYIKERLWTLSEEDRELRGKEIGKTNHQHDDWVIDMYQNRKFIAKWSQLKWETSPKRTKKRKQAYAKQFHTGKNFRVQRNVDIHREHYLDGTITIGNNVLFAKNVFIDYSGYLVIEDNVSLSDGVVIETHSHVSTGFALTGEGKLAQTHLVIEEGVSVGSKALIMDTCSRIGRHSRIGAGAVVRSNIPPYAIAIGNPAKVVGFVMTPEEVEKKEREYPKEKRITPEKFLAYYNKYFRERAHETKKYMKL